MGAYLQSQRLRHGELAVLARVIGQSTRTLRNRRRRGGREGRPGHPPRPEEERAAAREQIEPRWRDLPREHNGWRTVCACLAREGIDVPTRPVQEIVHELKSERTECERARIEANRVHALVLARDALGSADQTHLGRDAHGAIKRLVVRECYVPRTLALSVGPPACGADVVRLLEHAAKERGTWPFVVQLDNGSENHNTEMEACMREQQVIVLWNDPRTPEHNPRVERTIGSLKRESGLQAQQKKDAELDQGPVWPRETGVAPTRISLCGRLSAAWQRLDHDAPRAALDGRTPAEVDRIALRAEDVACRARFYEAVCEEQQGIALASGCARGRRKNVREATWRTLKRFGLVQRTRGGRLPPTVKAEGICEHHTVCAV